MNFPNVTDLEIAAVKKLSYDERTELAARINATDPHAIFEQAGATHDDTKRKIICPNCGNGNGNDATPVDATFVDGAWLYYCFKCNEFSGTLLKIIAHERNLNLNVGNDFSEALAIGAAFVGENVGNGNYSSHARKTTPRKSPKVEFTLPEPAHEYERLNEARLQIDSLFKGRDNWRGLRKETVARLLWGVLWDYAHPDHPDWKFSVMIIPNDKNGIFARELFGDRKSNIIPTAPTTIVRPSAEKFLFILEGAIDGASIAQVTDFQHGIITIGGTSGVKHCVARLKELFPDDAPKPKIILLLDNDGGEIKSTGNAGQYAATKLLPQLRELGFPAVNRVISDVPKRDPNKILVEDGEEALRNSVAQIVKSATEEFSKIKVTAPVSVSDKKIEQWQNDNGVIDPDLLSKLKDAALKIDTLEPITALVANDISTQRYLGFFKYYSLFSSTCQNFFVRLRDAKKAAKAKIIAFNKDNSKPEPTDEDKALYALDIKSIEDAVKKYRTEAERNHKKYIDYARAKELDDQREAAHASYIVTPPTTKDDAEDCPVNLVLPEGVIFNDEGIKVQDLDKQSGKDAPPIIEACQNLVVPTKVFHEESTHMTKYQVAFKVGHVWRKKTFDGRTLQDTRSVSELCNYGVHITNPRMAAIYFSKIISLNEQNGRLTEIRSFTKPGWQDDDCKLFVYPPSGEDYHVERNGVDYESIFTVRGESDKWLDFLKRTIQGPHNRIIIFAVGACLAAPLLKVIKVKNIQINFWGTSNLAKTPLPKIGLSVFGDPSEGKMMRSWGGTAKNRLTMAAAMNDFPQLLDEGETMNKKAELEKSEAIYNFFTGLINQANKRNGDVRKTESFRSVRFSTAEKPMLSTGDKRGAFKRVIDVHIKEAIFSDSDARKVHLFVENNHGHFGRKWIDYIIEHADEIREDFETICDDFEENGFFRDGKFVKFDSIDATNARSVIACFTAYFHFRVCVGHDEKFDAKHATGMSADQLAELPTIDDISDVKRSIELLASWVMENPKRFMEPKRHEDGTPIDGSDFDSASYAPTAGKKFANGDIGFFQSIFRTIIEDDLKLPSYEKFLCDLYDAGCLVCKDSRAKTKVVRTANGVARMYVIKSGALSPELDDDDDGE